MPAAVARGLEQVGVHALVTRGARVAITAGSRGIANLPAVLRAAADVVREAGGEPFIVPCMGSHGGATAEGQRAVLEGLGVTEESVGARSSPRWTSSPSARARSAARSGRRATAEADDVIVVNRVKPHTDFHGDIESGLVKMMVIGVGKHAGALSAQPHHPLRLPADRARPWRGAAGRAAGACGIAIVEDQHDHTALLEVLRPEEFFAREKELLVRANELLPRLPFDQLDVLVVDEIGKNISGTGMDTNVIGRVSFWGGGERPVKPRITRIFVRGLTARHPRQRLRHRHGRLHHGAVRRGDRPRRHRRQLHHVQLPGGRTHPHRLRQRPRGDRRGHADRRRARTRRTCGSPGSGTRRHLERIAVSEALLDEVRAGETLRPAGLLFPLPYDENGDLRSPFS